jgi:hypothetical protein
VVGIPGGGVVKALTIHQPWAWAIVHGGKNVENRTQRWKYRGPLAIHAGAAWSKRGAEFEPLQRAYAAWLGCDQWDGPYGGQKAMPIDPFGDERDRELIDFSAIIGIVDLVDIHDGYASRCCQPWGESGVGPSGYGITHLVLENPRPIIPIPCRGMLGLWTVPDDIVALIGDER